MTRSKQTWNQGRAYDSRRDPPTLACVLQVRGFVLFTSSRL